MATVSRTREREIARRIAFDEIDLERERQSQEHDYDDDVAQGEDSLLYIGEDFIQRFRELGGQRRHLVKAAAMLVAALEVNTDTERIG